MDGFREAHHLASCPFLMRGQLLRLRDRARVLLLGAILEMLDDESLQRGTITVATEVEIVLEPPIVALHVEQHVAFGACSDSPHAEPSFLAPLIGGVGRFKRSVAGWFQQAFLQAAEMRVDDENSYRQGRPEICPSRRLCAPGDIVDSVATCVGAARRKDQRDNVVAPQIPCLPRILPPFRTFDVEVVGSGRLGFVVLAAHGAGGRCSILARA